MTRRHASFRPRMLARLLPALALTGLLGCGGAPDLPQTYPVQGKVTYRGGGPVAGGSVQFQSEADTTVTTTGEIGPDGSFELTTLKGKHRTAGAVAGAHRVIITPPSGEDQGVEPVVLPELQTVKTGETRFNFVIDRPKR